MSEHAQYVFLVGRQYWKDRVYISKTFMFINSEICSVSHRIACSFIYICTVNALVCFFVCSTALLKFKIGCHPVIAQCILCVHNSITGVFNRISLYYRPGLILQCLLLVLAIGPEPLNIIFAIRGICTTTALPVGNRLKATTIVTGKGKCMVCASLTEEQKQKIINRKRYVKKDKAGISDVSKDESELLGEPDQGDIFEGSQQELEQAARSIYQSPPKPSNVVLGDPRAQVLGLDHLSLKTPQHVPETPGTVLKRRIEKSLGDQFQEQIGSFQRSMMDAFNKLAATVTVSKHPQDPRSPQGDQTKSHSKPGPSSAPSPPRPRYQQVPSHEPMDTTTAQVGPELPPRLRAQYSDIPSDPEMEPPRAESVEKVKKHKTNLNTSPPVMSAPHLRHPLTVPNPKNLADLPLSKGISPVIEIRKNQKRLLLLYIQ